MYSILDIDLDYFNLMPDAACHFEQLLNWADCSPSIVVERHNHAFGHWKKQWRTNGVSPSHILHVDEHHDMMDQRRQTNIANFMFHAMRLWPQCRVYWMVENPIDSPAMWLEEETWNSLQSRFSCGPNRPACWPKPNIVSVCTSPEFVDPNLESKLMEVLSEFMEKSLKKQSC